MVVLLSDCTVGPVQPALQYEASLHTRVRDRVPAPHVVLHGVHSAHAAQVPATGQHATVAGYVPVSLLLPAHTVAPQP